MKHWNERDWSHHNFLTTMCRLFERENVGYIYYDGVWWICVGSLFEAIQNKYLQYEGKHF